MATRRSDIVIAVQGIQELRSLNTSLNTYEKHLREIIQLHGQAAASGAQIVNSTQNMTRAQAAQLVVLQQSNNAILQQIAANTRLIATNTAAAQATQQSTQAFNAHGQSILATAIKYRAISFVFHEVIDLMKKTGEAVIDMDYQSARVQRVLPGTGKPEVQRMMQAEMIRTGQGAKELGEAFYQLGTFIHNDNELLAVTRTAMNLVVGTESDVRDTTRAMMQIYNQFGGQLDQTVSKSENFRRIGELIAVTYKSTNTEVGEITQALKYLGPIAEAARIPLAQVFGIVGAMEAGGQRGRMAGTATGQFITQLIKRGSESGTDLTVGKYVYENLIARTGDGGLDLIKTLQRIHDLVKSLPRTEMTHFVQAIAGTQNAFRFLGTLEETMGRMRDVTEKATEAMKGQTHEAERLKNVMSDTWTVQFQRAWAAVSSTTAEWFTQMDSGFLHIKGMLRDIGNEFQKWNAENDIMNQGESNIHAMTGRQQIMHDRSLLRSVVGNIPPGATGRQSLAGEYYTPAELGRLKQLGLLSHASGLPLDPEDEPGDYSFVASRDELLRRLADMPSEMQLNNLAEQERGLKWQRDHHMVFDPIANKLVPVREPGWAAFMFKKGGGKHLNPAEQEKQDRAAETARRKAAEAADRQAQEWGDQAKIIAMRHKDLDDPDWTPKERSEYDQLLEWQKRQKDKASELRGDPRRTRSQLILDKADDAPDKFTERKAEAVAKRRLEQLQTQAEIFGNAAEQHSGTAEGARYLGLQRNVLRQIARLKGDEGSVDLDRMDRWLDPAGKELRSFTQQTQLQARIDETASRGSELERMGFGRTLRDDEIDRIMQEHRDEVSLGGKMVKGKFVSRSQNIDTQIEDVNDRIAQILPSAGVSDEASKALRELGMELRKLGIDARDAKTKMGLSAQDIQFGIEEGGYEGAMRRFDQSDRPVSGKDEYKYRLLRNRQERAIADEAYWGSTKPEDREQYARRREDLDHSYSYMQQSKALQERDEVRQAITQGFMAFYHGQTGAGGFIRGVGDHIVDKAITAQLEKWTDPLVIGITNATTAQEKLTDATIKLTNAFLDPAGEGPGGGGSSGGGTPDNRPRLQKTPFGKWQAGDIIAAGSAAYSIYGNAAQSGVNLGNVLGAGMAGFQLGGLPGAAIGVGIDLLGGLFGHRKHDADPAKGQPAYYNSPGDFDYYAYRYRATGKLPDYNAIHAMDKQTVVININMDGVKRSVTAEVNKQTRSANVAMVNGWLDTHSPI